MTGSGGINTKVFYTRGGSEVRSLGAMLRYSYNANRWNTPKVCMWNTNKPLAGAIGIPTEIGSQESRSATSRGQCRGPEVVP